MEKKVFLTQEQKDRLLHQLYLSIGVLPPAVGSCKHFPEQLEECMELPPEDGWKVYTRFLRCKGCLSLFGQRKDNGTFQTLDPKHQSLTRICWFSKWAKVILPNAVEEGEEPDLVDKILNLLF